ncbi:MAG: inositol 2-dehydrogenase [bacterium]
MASQHTIKVGIIGAGRMGNLHAGHLAYRIPNATLAAIADLNPQKALKTAEAFHIPRATEDYREILDDASIDGVLICSNTDSHTFLIKEAASAGKHIFCEKPIDVNLESIAAALQAVEDAGVKLQVGFNRRFDANFQSIKKKIAADKIGQPHIIRITSRDPEPPPFEYLPTSGGLFLDMSIHDFDMACFLLQNEVVELYATGDVLVDSRFKEANDIDTAVVTLKFSSGAIGVIDNSRKAVYGYDQRVEVFGSKGLIQVSNNTPDNHVLMTSERVESSKPLYFFRERYKESFIAEIQAFVNAILNDTEPLISGKDSVTPVSIALGANRSLFENRPVKMSEMMS